MSVPDNIVSIEPFNKVNEIRIKKTPRNSSLQTSKRSPSLPTQNNSTELLYFSNKTIRKNETKQSNFIALYECIFSPMFESKTY